MKIGNRNYTHVFLDSVVINEDSSATIKCRTYDLPDITIHIPSEIILQAFEEAIQNVAKNLKDGGASK